MTKKLTAKDRQRAQLAWGTIATDLALTYGDSDHPSLTGKWENRAVSVKAYREGQGRVWQVVTGFELGNQYIFNTSFQLTRQGFLQDLMGKVGSRDVQIGDPAFDDAVLVKGWDEKAVQVLFQNERVRNACLNMMTNFRYADVKITNQKISGSVKGMVMNTSEVNTVLRHFLHVANFLEEEGAIIDGDTGKVIPEERESVESPVRLSIEDDDISGAVDVEHGLAMGVEEVDESKDACIGAMGSEQRGRDSENDNFSIPAIARSLFTEKLGKSESQQRFGECFKDREVDWRCKLSYIIPSGADPVFGTDSGWIAASKLDDIPGCENQTGTPTIRYRIGRKRKEAFDDRPGSELVIQGKLVNYDPDSLILYIDSGDAREKAKTHSATIIISM